MKNLFLVMAVLLTTTIYGQEFKSEVKKSTKQFELIYDDYYKVTFINDDGMITQKGFYIIGEDGKLIRHGKWSLINDSKVLTVGQFDNDKLVWIKSGGKKFTRQQIIDERTRLRMNRATTVAVNQTLTTN